MADSVVAITRDMELPEILSRYPGCRKVFDRYGLVGCGGPLGPQESLAFFARAHRVDEGRLLAELQEAARNSILETEAPGYTPGPGDVIEVTGLTLWAIDLWRAMGSRPQTVESTLLDSVGPETKVYAVIERYPETVSLFREFGFSMIDSPVAQRVFARSISIEQACRLKHVDFAAFQVALNDAIRKRCGESNGLIQLA